MRKFQVISRRSLILSIVGTGIVSPVKANEVRKPEHFPLIKSPEELIKTMQSVFIDGAMAYANYKHFHNPHHMDPGKTAFELGHRSMEKFTIASTQAILLSNQMRKKS